MNPAGIVLIIAGTWVCAQIFAGNALERMGIVKPSDEDAPNAIGGPLTPPAGNDPNASAARNTENGTATSDAKNATRK